MSTNPEEILSLFESFQKVVEEDQKKREGIQDLARELEVYVRQMLTILQGIHLEKEFKNCNEVLLKAKKIIAPCKELFQKLSLSLPPKEYYRYHDIWRNATQKLVFSIALIEYIESGSLASREVVAEQLSLKTGSSEGLHLDLDDYLHGILRLVSELSRLAVNSAACGDYQRPVLISQFVNELNAAFRLLTFKNDNLRKHFDSFKYDLKKIEEVVYDLSIRGLKNSERKLDSGADKTPNFAASSET